MIKNMASKGKGGGDTEARDSRAVFSTDSNQAQPRKVKKEKNVGDEEDDDDIRLTKRSSATKDSKELNRKKKKQKEEEKKKVSMVATELNGKDNRKREKKVYDLPGQKRDTPEERDPLRIFYETLYKHVPNSEMAQIWMMESGLLPREEAKILHEKRRKNDQNKLSSPLKAITPPN
ncbi:hypothetical protein K2173_007396 [Erythroxylum novogranatense]|uniref:Uncharacterized protein n=1 Tax=Erythroxylum novogranatense TaxID=1862640 RepID=A0AAV8T7Q0_9ROSI|nr:hypothetical protein K2173_007396 [Erythroxylum novogranatense]